MFVSVNCPQAQFGESVKATSLCGFYQLDANVKIAHTDAYRYSNIRITGKSFNSYMSVMYMYSPGVVRFTESILPVVLLYWLWEWQLVNMFWTYVVHRVRWFCVWKSWPSCILTVWSIDRVIYNIYIWDIDIHNPRKSLCMSVLNTRLNICPSLGNKCIWFCGPMNRR